MPGNADPATKFETLRRQAEALLQERHELSAADTPDILELVHELRIHQAELEIQNEELQRAQQELAELHRLYEDLYEFAPCGYITLNNKGAVTHMNLTASLILGAARGRVYPNGLYSFIDADWQDAYLKVRRECSVSGRQQSIEFPLKGDRDHASSLWVRADIVADFDLTGAVHQWRVVLIDITEAKAATSALMRSETKFRSMMESMTDPVYVCSPERTIAYMNTAMIERLGRDATGEICFKALHGLEKQCDWCQFEAVRGGQTVEINQESPLDKRTYRITSMPVLNDDRAISKMTIYRDITAYLAAVEEKEKAERQLRQAQKMESIGNLAGGIAHNFNNILASIIGFTELALDKAEKGSPLEDNLEEVFTAGKRAKELIEQILAFARQSDVELEPVKIGKIAEEVIKLLHSTTPTTIEIKQALSSDALVVCNETQLQQVFMNIATNALHAMEEDGGILEVRLEDIEVDDQFAEKHGLLKAGGYVKLSVADTGSGIPEEKLASIFEPYYTTKDVGKGTGMGLSLVFGTVKNSGGTIWVDSRLGRGTIFTILLPKVGNLSEAEPHQTEALPRGSERILVVDDEPPIAKIEQRLLESLGYTVSKSASSTEALALFQSNPDAFDLVLTDMTMPGLTGDRLAMELMKSRPDIPVILCTGYSSKISAEKASAIGIKAFAYKPLDKAKLAKTVRHVLDEANVKT